MFDFSVDYNMYITCIFLNMPNSVNLNSDEYSQGLCCYPFMVNLDVIILMIYPMKYVLHTKQNINFRVVIW